jgi:hypothetical protein
VGNNRILKIVQRHKIYRLLFKVSRPFGIYEFLINGDMVLAE